MSELPGRAAAVVPVSAGLRQARANAQTQHFTVGELVRHDDGTLTLPCSCGMDLTNGPGWTLDEHIRLHRAEAKFLALAAAAPVGIPRLVADHTTTSDPVALEPDLLAA